MAFDPEQHEIDPRTGLMVDKDTKHFVGLVPPPAAEVKDVEFPKWITPHESHIHRQESPGAPDHISTDQWETHVDRAGNVTVLVHDAEAEALAQGAKQDSSPAADADAPKNEPLE
jgi:hypothetical protein